MHRGVGMNAIIITARGNNQSLPDKNLIEIGGLPVLSYSIRAAKESRLGGGVYVCTDCRKIASTSVAEGARIIMRPDSLSGPDINHGDVILWAANKVNELEGGLEIVTVLLGNTAMTTPDDIDHCVLL